MHKLARRINYVWRMVGTALSFFFFGLGGLCLAFLVFPFVRLIPGTDQQKISRIQRTLHHTYRLFLGFMQFMGVCTVKVEGREKLMQGTHLLIANHPCLLDVVLILSVIPEADCIVKQAAWNNPFFRGVLRATGYVHSDDAMDLIETCTKRLQEGRSLLIFPEGTRSLPNKLNKFKRGAAAIAIHSQVPITPITITCTPTTLTKAEKWYHIPASRFELAMVVGNPIDVTTAIEGSRNHLIAYRKLTESMQNYFLNTGSYDGCA